MRLGRRRLSSEASVEGGRKMAAATLERLGEDLLVVQGALGRSGGGSFLS